MIVSMIVAHGPNGEIGLDNKLLWHLSEDLKNFKKITSGKVIVMGRKTFESIGKPLPNRKNIILTRDPSFKPEGVFVINEPMMAFDLALNFYEDAENAELIICGGEEIYKIFMPYTQKIYRTLVDFYGSADAFFPELNLFDWQVTFEEKHVGFIFQTLEKL